MCEVHGIEMLIQGVLFTLDPARMMTLMMLSKTYIFQLVPNCYIS